MELIGYLLTAVAIIPSVVQIKHSARLRSVAGLSGATTLAWVCSWSTWVMYGVLTSSGPMIARNLLGLVPAVVFLVVFCRLSRLSAPLPVVALYAATALVVDVRTGLSMLVVLDVYFYLPSVVRVFRERDLSGVSVRALVGQVAITSSWLVYLAVSGSVLAGVSWAVSVVVYVVTLVRVLHCRRAATPVPISLPVPVRTF